MTIKEALEKCLPVLILTETDGCEVGYNPTFVFVPNEFERVTGLCLQDVVDFFTEGRDEITEYFILRNRIENFSSFTKPLKEIREIDVYREKRKRVRLNCPIFLGSVEVLPKFYYSEK